MQTQRQNQMQTPTPKHNLSSLCFSPYFTHPSQSHTMHNETMLLILKETLKWSYMHQAEYQTTPGKSVVCSTEHHLYNWQDVT